jgi:hypothetical protein
MHLHLHTARRSLPLCLLILCAATVVNAADGFLIRLTADARVEVVPYQLPASGRDEQTGIAVWSRGGPEQWAVLPGKLNFAGAPSELAANLRAATRSGGASSSASGSEAMTFQPEQLLGQVVTRAVGLQFVTPADQGICLDGRITFRRQPDAGATKFPATEVKLRRGNRELLTIPFAAGQSEIRWEEIAKLPAALKAGLAPGDYSLRIGTGPLTSFRVADERTRTALLAPLDQLAKVAGGDSPAYLLALVQHLSVQPDEDGEVRSYSADALDRLDAAAKKTLALSKEVWFAQLRGRVWKKLTVVDDKTQIDVATTGIEVIDLARAAIQEGNWAAAQKTLALPAAAATPRAQALQLLYRAVIAAESGSGGMEPADELYRAAIDGLQGGNSADLFRAHNNYGGMLFARARDQVHNHAFQTATGTAVPILRALDDWSGALFNFEQALGHAEKLDPALAAGVRINLAGLYNLLADLIRVLDLPAAGERRFVAGEAAAKKIAAEQATQVISQGKQLDAVTRAAAHEALAQLAYRGEDNAVAKNHAQQALNAWVEAESLPGVESIERLLGLLEQNDATAALRHLQTSQLLTELLRSRIPADRTGRSRAGFFARRAFVYERIIELLLKQGDARAALRMAEGAKARSLQEVLIQRGVTKATEEKPDSLDNLLAAWPADTAAIEYFLGTERAWAFVINARGEVQALQLVDQSGKPLESRDLIRRVQTLLVEFEGQSNKMFRRASAGNGFDHAWQDELHRFCGELLPDKIRAELKTAKHVVFVPHHVLHYFPFAALVTKLDPVTRGKLELPQPQFLIDEPFSISRAPSLAAWSLLRAKESKFAQVQAVGIVEFERADPLPGVEQDLSNLQAAFGSRLQKITTAGEATEQNIQAALREPGMLFIGTHGTNVADQPLASHLMCTAGTNEDGLLTAGELFSSEVNSTVVVLSACYSGLADRSPLPSDDLFGLERSFLNSGATTVVSGLWDVYDGTGPMLMKSFFAELVAGQPSAAALAGAQRKFLADRRKEGAGDPWIHPYFWAVYAVSGSERTTFIPAAP